MSNIYDCNVDEYWRICLQGVWIKRCRWRKYSTIATFVITYRTYNKKTLKSTRMKQDLLHKMLELYLNFISYIVRGTSLESCSFVSTIWTNTMGGTNKWFDGDQVPLIIIVIDENSPGKFLVYQHNLHQLHLVWNDDCKF